MPRNLRNRLTVSLADAGKRLKPLGTVDWLDSTAMNRGVNERGFR